MAIYRSTEWRWFVSFVARRSYALQSQLCQSSRYRCCGSCFSVVSGWFSDVLGGIPESLRRRKDRNLLLCGLCCGLRPFGPGFDGLDRRRYMCLRIDAGRRFRGLSEGGRRSWVVRLFSSRVCVSSSRLSISGRRSGRRSMWFRRVAGNFRAVFYISLFGRLNLR